jgi:hypothetical protein
MTTRASTFRNLIKIASAVLVLLLICWPILAYADPVLPTVGPATEPTALQNFVNQVLAILAPVIISALGVVTTWILFKIKQKLHIEVSQATQDAWAKLANDAAHRGAEWARQQALAAVGDKKIPGGAVMDVAANWAMQMAEQQKLPDMARAKLTGLIESELFKIRRDDAATGIGDQAKFDPSKPLPDPKNPPPTI